MKKIFFVNILILLASSAMSQIFDRDGFIDLAFEGRQNSKYQNDSWYFNYVFPGWRIPPNMVRRENPLAYQPDNIWNDNDCNIYHYWYNVNIGHKKRLVSFIKTPGYDYKIFNNGEIIINKAYSTSIFAKRTGVTNSIPADDSYMEIDASILRSLNKPPHPCEMPIYERLVYSKTNTLQRDYHVAHRSQRDIRVTAASQAKGNLVVLGGNCKELVNQEINDLFWELIDSSGKSMGKKIYRRPGDQNLTAVLTYNTVIKKQSKAVGKEIFNKSRFTDKFSDFGFLLVGTSDEDNHRYSDFISTKKEFYAIMCNRKGDVLWEKKYGGDGNDVCTAAIATQDGKYFILSGISNSGLGRDISKPRVNNSGRDYDYWCIKIDREGNIIWDGRYGSTSNDSLTSVIETYKGEILLGGYTSGTVSFGRDAHGNVGSGIMPGHNFYVIKIDSAGKFKWGRLFGGLGDDRGYQILQRGSDKRMFEIWGTSNSEELFPRSISSLVSFESNLGAIYQRTRTCIGNVTFDDDGNNHGSYYYKPSTLKSRTDDNVFMYGYVYYNRRGEAKIEYIYALILQIVCETRKYIYNEPPDDRRQIEVWYKCANDPIILDIHSN